MNKHLLRHAILLQLEVAYLASLPLETLLPGIRLAGYSSLSDKELEKELHYLAEKQFVSMAPQQLTQALFRYQLTAIGRDYLEKEGLA